MKKTLFFFFLSFPILTFANPSYLKKFDTYRYWSSHLPPQYNADLINFIEKPGQLNSRLREKWLLLLGEKQNWQLLTKYYTKSESTRLQCYAATAFWHENQKNKAVQIATSLWLYGHHQPKACTEIFQTLSAQPNWRALYWKKRIQLALDERDIHLARELLQHGRPWDKKAADDFWRIHTQPEFIKRIKPGPWYGEEQLYALKRMIYLNRELSKVEAFYNEALKLKRLNNAQIQRFTSFMSLYLAMRNDAKTLIWFNKVKSPYDNLTLMDWQMRYALLHRNFKRVQYIIHKLPKPLTPEQTYWLAKAELTLGEKEAANLRLSKLSKERNYYGFLASIEKHQKLSFIENPSCHNYAILKDYQVFLNEISLNYHQKSIGKASQLLSDFILELPKIEKCTLVDWVSNRLNWPNEAILLSNQPKLFDQIDIRFPIKFIKDIQYQAKLNHLDTAFVLAIVRQESAFHPEIISPAGARGLMQMMPRTARLLSKRYRIPFKRDNDLYNPQKNIQLGTRYLSELNQHINHPLLVAAAYNAGPYTVSKWLKQNNTSDILIWIDTLPWRETRNYIKNIVAFNAIYQHRMHQEIKMEALLKPLPTQKTCSAEK